jgi:hypothetical protein
MNWLNQGVLHLASVLVREPDRTAWLAEWKSELWYVRRADGTALRFCLGAFPDALWLRRNRVVSECPQFLRLESPARCLACLAVIAATTAIVFFRAQSFIGAILPPPQGQRGLTSIHFLLITVALVILPTTTSLALGEYPSRRFRRWIFLLSKFALILPAVFFGTLDLVPIFRVGLFPDLVVLSYVLAFRWALIDQRQRCPVCLRLLASPARFGDASHTLLDWYGTEFFCTRGHGLLHVPEIRTSYSTERWLDLDPSWQSLFSGQSS